MDEAAAAGTRIVQKTQTDETGGRVMYAASEESRCILRTSDARPYGSDEMRWGAKLSVGFADSSPWEGKPMGEVVYIGMYS